MCRMKVSFVKSFDEDTGGEVYKRGDLYPYHCHERDMTILPNSIIYSINDYVTAFGYDANLKIDAMDVINWIEQRYTRKFDYPSLFHYLSQQFEIKHNNESLTFAKRVQTEKVTEAYKVIVFDVDPVKVHQVVTKTALMLQIEDHYAKNLQISGVYDSVCTDVLYVELFDLFKLPGCQLVLVSTFDNSGNMRLLGMVVYNDIQNLEKGLSHFSVLLQPYSRSIVFAEPESDIASACISQF